MEPQRKLGAVDELKSSVATGDRGDDGDDLVRLDAGQAQTRCNLLKLHSVRSSCHVRGHTALGARAPSPRSVREYRYQMKELGGTPSGPRVLPQRSRLRSTAKRLGLDVEEGPRLVQREWGMSPVPCPTTSRRKGPGRGDRLPGRVAGAEPPTSRSGAA